MSVIDGRPGQNVGREESSSDQNDEASDLAEVEVERGALDAAQRAAVESILATSGWAIGHVHQVRRLATRLFDGLREFHGLGDDEAVLLEAAALLHDVGYPIDPARHHKVSARIIRTFLGPPFAAEQVELIALLARYHRKALPKLRHRRYGRLDARRRRVVLWLGGILRVADGLDRAHDSAVRWLAVSPVDGRLDLRVGERPPTAPLADLRRPTRAPRLLVSRLALDVEGARRKRDLLERAIGMAVSIRAVTTGDESGGRG